MHSEFDELLPGDFRLLALSREFTSVEQFVAGQQKSLQAYLGEGRRSDEVLQRFCKRFHYVSLECTDIKQYSGLKEHPDPNRVSIFYFATPPSLSQSICENVNDSGCLTEQFRVVLEKSFGRDHANCKEVNETVGGYIDEHRTYRIDHYLGKEAAQNLLALRFANRFISG